MSSRSRHRELPRAPPWPRLRPGEGQADADAYHRQLEAVATNATLALFILDERQHCTYMNAAAEQLTGYTLAEVQGAPLHAFVHHARPDGTPYPLAECPIHRAVPQHLREQGEAVFVHKQGWFYPVAFTASPLRAGERTVGAVVEVQDITQRQRLGLLAEASRVFAAARPDLAEVSQIVVRLVGDAFGDFCSLSLVEPDGQTLALSPPTTPTPRSLTWVSGWPRPRPNASGWA